MQRFALMIRVRVNEEWRWDTLRICDNYIEARRNSKPWTEIVPYASEQYDRMLRFRAKAIPLPSLRPRLKIPPEEAHRYIVVNLSDNSVLIMARSEEQE